MSYQLYLGENLLCPPCDQDTDSDSCPFIECGGTLLFSECGMIREPGFFYYVDCCKCECVKTSILDIWDDISWQANKFCNLGYKIDVNATLTTDKKSIKYNQYLLHQP